MTGPSDPARPRVRSRFDPFRPLDMLTSLWSATAMVPVNSGAAAAYRTLFVTMRRLVVGRRLTVALDQDDVTMTVTEVESRLDVRALSVGQLGDVTLVARDIRWRSAAFDNATVVLRNVHMKPSAPPVLVAAPVEVTLEVPATALTELLTVAAPRLRGELRPDGTARLRLLRRPGLGHVDVTPRLDGATLWLHPRTLGLGGTRWRLPKRAPAYPLRLPALTHALTVTDVAVGPDVVRLSATVPQWHAEMPRKRLEDIITHLSVTGVVVNLSRLGRLW